MAKPCSMDPAAATFKEHAANYCAFINSLVKGNSPPSRYMTLLGLLSRLVASGLDLPHCLPEDDLEEELVSSAERQTLSQGVADAVAAVTKELEAYYQRDNPSGPARTRALMLFDDLADLYCDLLDGLRLFELGGADHIDEALWRWRDGYENHWGQHLFRALATVHEICFLLKSPWKPPNPRMQTDAAVNSDGGDQGK